MFRACRSVVGLSGSLVTLRQSVVRNSILHQCWNNSNHTYALGDKNLLGEPARHYCTDGQPPIKENIPREAKSTSKRKLKLKPKPIQKKEKFNKKLGDQSRENVVPGSRMGRIANFGQLAMGLGAGAVAELAMRGMGLSKKADGSLGKTPILQSSPLLSEANAERIVMTLCKVRGAALKLGQMISIQDSAMIDPQLMKIFERVRQGADFMPGWQMQRMMKAELGEAWRDELASFDEQPFAAASIGQVHRATLHDGREVAMKIQYPGVADSIDSDLDNLISVLKVVNVLPEGMYAGDILQFARKELKWECDYVREAEMGTRFRALMEDNNDFYVPEVIPELSTKHVLTHELVSGDPVDKLKDVSQETLNNICACILRHCLEELFTFRFMQTDPNWSNFLYDYESGRICLLDFGAARDFDAKFTDPYIELINCAAQNDREGVHRYSCDLGFLTGHEAKVMKEAHIESVMILGEAFRKDEPFNFADQSTSSRIHDLVPTMLKHRLTPPPEEVYSLHRKMAGCFLLCAKLNAVINCKSMFDDVYSRYGAASEPSQFGGGGCDL